MNAKTLVNMLADIAQETFDVSIEPIVSRPEEKFGDFATNVALQLGGRLQKDPGEVAEVIADQLRMRGSQQLQEVTIAGPGFINVRLTTEALVQALTHSPEKKLHGQQVLVEFGDPNPFKAMHLGHLYTTIVGQAIANLLGQAGAEVKRLSYHGDVGLHVAKAMWALLRHEQQVSAGVSEQEIGAFYAQGATAYKNDLQAKAEIEALNERIYQLRLEAKTDDPRLATLYDIGFKTSFKGFEALFAQLGVQYAKRYLESESTKVGLEYVRQNTGTVFEESEGAVIYRGEKAGLHTRVFINSRGLPTYEAKDLGLAELKNRDYPDAAKSIIITANEQSEYFKVMLAALNQIDPDTATKTRHLPHGFLSLNTGKMSSRRGIDASQLAANLLDAVRQAARQQFPDASAKVEQAVYLAAVKYSFLKHRIGGDIVFNVQESVALEGNSGPYVQYAHARARSILQKADAQPAANLNDLDAAERSLVRKISEYPEVLGRAAAELMPHHVCTYLYELAQTFNRFYENNRVIDDPRQGVRLAQVGAYAKVLKDGLEVLGIAAPEHL